MTQITNQTHFKTLNTYGFMYYENILNIIGHFRWTWPLFITGFKRDLCEDDLFQPLDMHRSNKLGDEMEK